MRTGWMAAMAQRWRARCENGPDERGAAMVEAAIIFPLVVFLTFGAIEFGFTFNEQGTVRQATRSAARVASANPTSSTADFESRTLSAASTAAQNIVTGRPVEVWIYDADPFDSGSYSKPGTCATHCVSYDWSGPSDSGSFSIPSGGSGWDPADREACPGSSDRVGVYMLVTHNFLTGLPYFSGDSSIDLSANTIMALEPDPTATGC